MSLSNSEREYLTLLYEKGKKIISNLYSEIYRYVLKHRILKKMDKMKEDIELIQRVLNKYPDLGISSKSEITEIHKKIYQTTYKQ